MLVLSRELGEKIAIGDVVITVVDIAARDAVNKVRLGIEAPRDTVIQRMERNGAKALDSAAAVNGASKSQAIDLAEAIRQRDLYRDALFGILRAEWANVSIEDLLALKDSGAEMDGILRSLDAEAAHGG